MAPVKKQTKQPNQANKALDHVSTHAISKSARNGDKSQKRDKSPRTQRIETYVQGTLENNATPGSSVRISQSGESQEPSPNMSLEGRGLELILPDLASIKRKLQRIEASTKHVDPMARAMDDVNGNALNGSVNSDVLVQTLQALNRFAKRFCDKSAADLQSVDDKIDSIQEKADENCENSEEIIEKVDVIDDKLDSIESQISYIDSNTNEIDSKLYYLGDKVDGIVGQVSETSERITDMAPQVAYLTERTDEICENAENSSNNTDQILQILQRIPNDVADQRTVTQIGLSVHSLVEKHITYMRSFERMHNRMEKIEKLLARGPQVNVIYRPDAA